MKKKAFTLAEALITLAIIGVVATLTLPNLMVNTQTSELQARFMKTYNDLESFAGYFKAQEDMSIPLYTSIYGSVALKNKYTDYMAKVTTTSNWVAADKHNGGIEEPYSWYQLANNNQVVGLCDASGFVEDGVGRIISFDDQPPRGFNGPRVCVDINGKKAPNRHGVDVFSFMFTTDGSIIPSGDTHPNNNSYDERDDKNEIGAAWLAYTTTGADKCYSHAQGLTCAYYAFKDVNPKNEAQTYWKDFIGKKQYLNK